MNGGCSNAPQGKNYPAILAQENGEGVKFYSLGFHDCDGPMEDGEFAEGTKCAKISCFGKNSDINEENAECVCGDDGCHWMKQEDHQVSAVPACPSGCAKAEGG